MADHFEEVVNLRLHQLDERIDDEASAVKEHFQELKTFITEGFAKQSAELRAEFRAELGAVNADVSTLKADVSTLKADVSTLKTDVAGLKTDVAIMKTDISVLKGDVAGLRREFGRLEYKMDAQFETVHVVLRDIQSRLPPAEARRT